MKKILLITILEIILFFNNCGLQDELYGYHNIEADCNRSKIITTLVFSDEKIVSESVDIEEIKKYLIISLLLNCTRKSSGLLE